MTLLREIQTEVAKANSDLGAVLRKFKILAVRLKSQEFGQWISWELDGYPDGQQVPPYRKLNAQYFANFMKAGWNAPKQPFLWPVLGKDAYDKLNPVEFRDGIAKVQALSKGGIVPRPELGLLVQGKMYPDLNCVGAWMEIGGNEFQQLLSAVRTRVLDFVLEIEGANPNAGEAEPDTEPVPPEGLQPIIQNVFHGSVGNVAQNSQQFTQTAQLGRDRARGGPVDSEYHRRSDRELDRHRSATFSVDLDSLDSCALEQVASGRRRKPLRGLVSCSRAATRTPTVTHRSLLRRYCGLIGKSFRKPAGFVPMSAHSC